MTLETRTIGARYPCCAKVAKFVTLVDLPRESFDRVCRECGCKWYVMLTRLSEAPGVTVTRVEWADGERWAEICLRDAS